MIKIHTPGGVVVVKCDNKVLATLPDGTSVTIYSRGYGFSIAAPEELKGRFVDGYILQLADGILAEATSDSKQD